MLSWLATYSNMFQHCEAAWTVWSGLFIFFGLGWFACKLREYHFILRAVLEGARNIPHFGEGLYLLDFQPLGSRDIQLMLLLSTRFRMELFASLLSRLKSQFLEEDSSFYNLDGLGCKIVLALLFYLFSLFISVVFLF